MTYLSASLISRILSLFIPLATFAGCTVFGIRSGFEEVPYEVIDTVSDIEIRKYPSRVAVEVTHASSSSEAFRALFEYISGNNISQSKVAMTTPVQIDRTTTVAMTVPVEASSSNNKVERMRFFLPRAFTKETAPLPKNDKLNIIELPAETRAVLRYTWSSSDSRFRKKSKALLIALKDSPWKVEGEPSFFGFDPPFTLPFLKRNEVSTKVSPRR
jgi:SOUL heme-binding protein